MIPPQNDSNQIHSQLSITDYIVIIMGNLFTLFSLYMQINMWTWLSLELLILSKLLEQRWWTLPGENRESCTPIPLYIEHLCTILHVEFYKQTTISICSVSLLLTTTEAAVVDRQGEKNPLANRMPNIDY